MSNTVIAREQLQTKGAEFYQQYLGKNKHNNDVLTSLLRPLNPKYVDDHYRQATFLNSIQQADVLYLTTDPVTKDKYALVVTDLATRRIDAEPLKTRTAQAVLDAFKHIYDRSVLKPPWRLEVDGGREFTGLVEEYFKEHNTDIRVARSGRHSQEGAVENINRLLGKAIAMRQVGQELHTGKQSHEWVEDLPQFVDEINKRLVREPPKAVNPDAPIEFGNKFFKVGDTVRVAEDRPHSLVILDSSGKQRHLSGQIRAGDPKWSLKLHKVEQVAIIPGGPVRYIVSDIPNVSFSYNQLQSADAADLLPPKKLVMRLKPEPQINEKERLELEKQKLYIPEQILDLTKTKVKIKWKGYDINDSTWEPISEIKKSSLYPELLARYRITHN